MTCQAAVTASTDCGKHATHTATYRAACECWPRTKTFCAAHADQVVREWKFPFDNGLCADCDGEIKLLRVEATCSGSSSDSLSA